MTIYQRRLMYIEALWSEKLFRILFGVILPAVLILSFYYGTSEKQKIKKEQNKKDILTVEKEHNKKKMFVKYN